jgi:hypothetical protein
LAREVKPFGAREKRDDGKDASSQTGEPNAFCAIQSRERRALRTGFPAG